MDIFIDGTWCTEKDNSNVYKLYKDLGGRYYRGPGTRAFFLDKILGGVFGLGTASIVDKAFEDFKESYEGGPIRIIGYSRGAAAARMLANEICKLGHEVEFLGCFDTVGAFGVPVNILGIKFQEINLFADMVVNDNVKRAVHLVSLDEYKPAAFASTPMRDRWGITTVPFHEDHAYVGKSEETYSHMLYEIKDYR
jgi:uncharacterized protein (DUF2235 family)